MKRLLVTLLATVFFSGVAYGQAKVGAGKKAKMESCSSDTRGSLYSISDASSGGSCVRSEPVGNLQVLCQCKNDGEGNYAWTSMDADLSPYVLLAGDADGQTIQGIAGAGHEFLLFNENGAFLYSGDEASYLVISNGEVSLNAGVSLVISSSGTIDAPFALLAGDADGQQIQGVSGSNKPRLNLAGTGLNIYGDGASPAQIQIEGGYINLSTPDNFSSMYIGNLDASIRVSTDGTAETQSFLNVDGNGVELDVHDGVAQFQMDDNGTVFTGAVFRLNGMTVPTTASDPCFAGAVAWDSGFWYVCIALDTWKRTALSTW